MVQTMRTIRPYEPYGLQGLHEALETAIDCGGWRAYSINYSVDCRPQSLESLRERLAKTCRRRSSKKTETSTSRRAHIKTAPNSGAKSIEIPNNVGKEAKQFQKRDNYANSRFSNKLSNYWPINKCASVCLLSHCVITSCYHFMLSSHFII